MHVHGMLDLVGGAPGQDEAEAQEADEAGGMATGSGHPRAFAGRGPWVEAGTDAVVDAVPTPAISTCSRIQG